MDTEPTAEELAAEQAAVQVPKEEEIRANIIAEYQFDEDADKDRIDKLVQKDLDQRTKLSNAIGQKIKHRTEANELRKKIPPEGKKEEKKEDAHLNNFSIKDALALQEGGVTSEDYDEVVRVATILGKPIVDALKDKTLQTILATRKEERKTAETTQTGKGNARGASQATGEEMLAEAEKTGKLPESEADVQKLFLARQAKRKTT